jgi:hypothetical protein
MSLLIAGGMVAYRSLYWHWLLQGIIYSITPLLISYNMQLNPSVA